MAWKVFQNNTALTAEDLNDVIVEQGVITFADATERNNAIPVPNPGMHCHLLSTKRSYYYDASAGWVELLPGTVSGLTALSVIRCTSTTRPAHAAGRIIFETDTGVTRVSNGTVWTALVQQSDTGWVNITPPVFWNVGASGLRYRVMNGVGTLQLHAFASTTWANDALVLNLPAVVRPSIQITAATIVYGNRPSILSINPDGTVRIGMAGAANDGYFCAVSYPLG